MWTYLILFDFVATIHLCEMCEGILEDSIQQWISAGYPLLDGGVHICCYAEEGAK